METKDTPGFGQVIFEAGKHIFPREVIATATMEDGLGTLVHILGLDDGATVTISRNLQQAKNIFHHGTLLVQGKSSWKDWEAKDQPFEQVITTARENGFKLRSCRNPLSKNAQLPLMGVRAPLS